MATRQGTAQCKNHNFCDNESVVHMVNKLGSTCKQCMKLIRVIAIESITWNRKVSVKHLSSNDNYLADSLSRLHLKRFWKLAPGYMNSEKDRVDSLQFIWPMSKLWFDETNYLPPL